MSRIDSIDSLRNADMSDADIFYRGMRKYFLYFEDNGKESFYKNLLWELFPEEKENIYVDTTSTGKSDLTKKYFDNREKYVNTFNKKFIFVLDKDFDDKRFFMKCKNLLGKTFEEVKNHENFLILSHYSIENYFLKKKEIIAAACFMAFGIDKQFIIDNFDKIKKLFIKISRLIYIHNVIDLNKKSGAGRFIDLSTISLKNDEVIKVEKWYEENFNKRKDFIFREKSCNKDFNYSKVKDIVLNLFDNERDIIGKELMLTIMQIAKVKYQVKEFNKDAFLRILSIKALEQKDEALEELKEEFSVIFKNSI